MLAVLTMAPVVADDGCRDREGRRRTDGEIDGRVDVAAAGGGARCAGRWRRTSTTPRSSPAGKVSTTGAATTADGPAFEATIVYVMTSPGWALTRPSVLVIDRSASGFSVSVSVAELLPGDRIGDAGRRGDRRGVGERRHRRGRHRRVDGERRRATDGEVDVGGDVARRRWPGRCHRRRCTSTSLPSRSAGRRSVTVAPATADGPALPADDGVGHGRARDDVGLAVGLGHEQVGLRRQRVDVGGRVVTRVGIGRADRRGDRSRVDQTFRWRRRSIVAVTVYVTEAPDGRLTMSAMLPAPLAAQVAAGSASACPRCPVERCAG